MKLEEFRKYFNQLKPGEIFYARPIFNDDFMLRMSELLGKDNYKKFEYLIEKDNSIELKDFLENNYSVKNGHSNLKRYHEMVSMDFDILLEPDIETEHPYYLGFYSDLIPLYIVIELLCVYFDNESSNYWLTGTIAKDSSTKSEEKHIKINGELIFMASPASTHEFTLCISKETTDIKDKAKLCKIINQLKKEYEDKLYDDPKPLTENDIPLSVKEIHCYNIGQGNCIRLNGLDDENIFFDVGLTKYKYEKKQKEIINNIEKIKLIHPDIIILSHWDEDHIMGLLLWDDSIYTKTWIVPDIRSLCFDSEGQERKSIKVSSYALRIYIKLLKCKSSNVYIISEKLEKTCIYNKNKSHQNPGIEIWTGVRIESSYKNHKITSNNNFGLIIVVHGSCKNTILCGDCDYKIIADSINQAHHYDNVIVSHHGAMMNPFPFTPLPQNKGNAKAIVSYGIFNNHKHPNNSTINTISKNGYQIIPTVGLFKYVINILDENVENLRIYGL